MGSTGAGGVRSARSASRPANRNTGRRVKTGYTTRIQGASGRTSEVYSNTRAEANAVAERARNAGSRTRTTRGRRRTR